MMPLKPPICFDCKYFIMELFNWHCEAFPEGIPNDIVSSAFDHHKPHEGDHGIQYVKIRKKERYKTGHQERKDSDTQADRSII